MTNPMDNLPTRIRHVLAVTKDPSYEDSIPDVFPAAIQCILGLLDVVKQQREALNTAKRALCMLGSEIPNLRADRGGDPRLATPANYAAELAKMAKSAMEPAILRSQPLADVLEG